MSDSSQPHAGKYLLRGMDEAGREFYRRLSEGELATTRCGSCGRTSFPPRLDCIDCGQPALWIELPDEGRLYAFTTQETALRFRAPAVVGLVELGEVLVPGLVEAPYEELDIDDQVRAESRPEPDTGLTVLSFLVC